MLNWLEYGGILNAIPAHWKFFLQTENLLDFTQPKYRLLETSKVSRIVYNMLISNEDVIKKYWVRWKLNLEEMIELEDYKKSFIVLYYITNIVKLRNFQYRILLDKVFCNKILCKWGVVATPKCTFCNTNEETVMHLLCECSYVNRIWQIVMQYLAERKCEFIFSDSDIIFHSADRPQAIHSIVLLVKQYIYSKRCKNERPKSVEIKFIVNEHIQLEKYNAKISGKYTKHVKKWSILFPELLETLTSSDHEIDPNIKEI